MPTNEEIREEYTIVMSGYEPKARGTKADRELCLMNEARADTAEQIFKKLDKILVFYPLNQVMINEIIAEYKTLKKEYNIEE